MKTKNILISALLALAAVASAQADVVAGLNDVILGFGKSSSTGSTSNLEVDLGSITNFKTGGSLATGSEVFLSQLKVADLNATYGTGTGTAGWKSTATTWAVVGTNGSGHTLWGTQASPEAPGSSQGAGASAIASAYAGLNGQTATANSASAAVVSTADANSWKNTSSGNFSYWSSSIFKNNSALASAGPVSVGFYEYVESAASSPLLGTFKLYSNGDFSFTSVVAIPEPSVYAAILGAATLGFAAIRRRKQNQLVA